MKPMKRFLPICCLLLLTALPLGAQSRRKMPEGARLQFRTQTHDFGDVERRGGDLVCEFVFTNAGTAPLVLTRVVTTCSCLKVHYAKRPVAPGAEGSIRVVYEPHKSEPGVFNKVIQIYSNSTGGREVVTVQGNSLEESSIKIKGGKVKIRH